MKMPAASLRPLSRGESVRVISVIKALETEKIVPKYLPRAMLRAFRDRYKHKIEGMANAGVLQELIDHVLGNDSKGGHGIRGKELRRRVELFLEQDEEDIEAIATDLRRHNGSKEVYTRFYRILADYLQAEESKVDARRHQGANQIPTAWSFKNLRQNIIAFQKERADEVPVVPLAKHKALEESEIPSVQWLRLIFCPTNAWLETSTAYKCKFELSSKLMSRSAHHDHPDSEYAARVFKHLRHLAIELKQLGIHVVLVFVDDKCSAKCGEPGDAVAATERNKRVITNAAMAAIASMHDFAKFKINPSVLLLADIPDDINLSFYISWSSIRVSQRCCLPAFDTIKAFN